MRTRSGGAGGPAVDAAPDPGLVRARAAKARLRALLAGRPGVCGVGLVRTADGWALRVDVEDVACGPDVPLEVDGVRVLTRVTGRLAPCPGLGEAPGGEAGVPAPGERGGPWATRRS